MGTIVFNESIVSHVLVISPCSMKCVELCIIKSNLKTTTVGKNYRDFSKLGLLKYSCFVYNFTEAKLLDL